MREEIGMYSQDERPIPLQGLKVNVHLHDLLSEVTIEQHYKNSEETNIEAVYTFPLPQSAVLMELVLEIGGRSLQGKITANHVAEERYEEAVTDGDTAVLLQKRTDGLYTINLGNLQSGESAIIRFRYAELHQWQGDQLRFLLPTVIAERYGDPARSGLQPHEHPITDGMVEHAYQMSLRVSGTLLQARLECPTHPVQTIDEGSSLLVQPADQTTFMDRDFILNMHRLDKAVDAGALITAVDPYQEGMNILMASFQPQIKHAEKKNHPVSLKILVDCSGSMGGDSISQTREAIMEIMGRLQEEDEFNIICFGNSVRPFKRRMVPVSSKSIDTGRRLVENLDANLGGTELGNALTTTYALQGDSSIASDILLITDGEIWDGDEIYDEAIASGHRIFTVGVGSAVSESFVRKIAAVSGGATELVTPNEQMVEHIVRHFERIRSAEVSATINWNVEPVYQTPKQFDRVFEVDTIHAFCSTNDLLPEEITVDYAGNDIAPVTHQIKASPAAIGGDTLARLAAWSRIQEIEDKEAETALAVQYQLLTEYTGMTAVDARTAEQQTADLPELRTVPQMRAAGWGGTGSVKPCLIEPMPMMRSGTDDYAPTQKSMLDRPTFMRMECRDDEAKFSRQSSSNLDEEYLDIPSFLRTQADDSPRTDTITHFSDELNGYYQSWKLINRIASSWEIEQLERFGLPGFVSSWLQTLVIDEESEKQAVILFLYKFIQTPSGVGVNKIAQRIIKKRYKALLLDRAIEQPIQNYIAEIINNEWPDSQFMNSAGRAVL
ncbi:MAG: VWA domain-containing protein [Gammaproteobacteria bacterium]|jgi:Ca-activated chloride channel family protein|nr:VWA domain-containing protein [Gammaproteobacteria bacterium]MBT4607204.1 VWA domain-containing protein [Thiotrichales bacterium]MBT5371339.1 VWA domain-containing protein [Gammaproteobacteria bacterium]MBT5635845.1 VWA domain-containing protein [Gammaproteobacteria bacterium]MBT7141171.1 VWA domain-containing protein [Gammaproteobacteria bacterium]